MKRHRLGASLLCLAAVCAALVLHALWIRPRLLTWGAGRDEATGAYPGDELVPEADSLSTMATTLPGPPQSVWPWLVQMGYDRAGWYSWDRLDHGGEPSSDCIVPEWQSLEPGQCLNSMPNGRNWMTVALLEPNRTLVLRSYYELPSMRSFDPRYRPLPRAYVDAIWGFHLRPTPGDGTRLVVRKRARSSPRRLTLPFTRAYNLLLGEPEHFIMQTRQFHNLRTRVGAQL